MKQVRAWVGTLAFAVFSFAWAFLLQVWSVIAGREPANFNWSHDLVASVFPLGIGVTYMAPVVLLALRRNVHFKVRVGIFIAVSIVVKMLGSSTLYFPGFVVFAGISSLFAVGVRYLGTIEEFWWFITAYWIAICVGFWVALAGNRIIARFDSVWQPGLIIVFQIGCTAFLTFAAFKINGKLSAKSIVALVTFFILLLLLPYAYLVAGIPAARF